MTKLVNAAHRAVLREAIQETEGKSVLAAHHAAGLSCWTLKGSVLKHDYPCPELHIMTDVDILVPKERRGTAEKILRELGYARRLGYEKPSLMRLELHDALDGDLLNPTASWTREPLVMTRNKSYVNHILRMKKHYRDHGWGCGSCRTSLCWRRPTVWCWTGRPELRARRLGAFVFGQTVRVQAGSWFGRAALGGCSGQDSGQAAGAEKRGTERGEKP